MITEDYCSYEVAKLLKEKGFDEPCTELNKLCLRDGEKPVLKVTHQKAMKWLREKGHNIILTMLPKDDDCFVLWTFNICSNKNYKIMWGTKQPKYNSYEDAVEAALNYCLENLI